jgi:hypothetical protein
MEFSQLAAASSRPPGSPEPGPPPAGAAPGAISDSIRGQDAEGTASAIGALVHFCEDINVGTDDADRPLLKVLVCNLQYIARQTLYAQLFGTDAYANWEVVDARRKRAQSRKKGNPLGGATTWYYLLRFATANRAAFQQQPNACKVAHRPFYVVYDAITSEFRNEGGAAGGVDLATIVRAFFIVNIFGITPLTALDNLLTRTLNRPVRSEAQNIMIQISSEKFTPEQYEATIRWLVESGVLGVDGERFGREVAFHRHKKKNATDAVKKHIAQVRRSARPSLIAIARKARGAGDGVTAVDAALAVPGGSGSAAGAGGYEKFYAYDMFLQRMRFTNSLSKHMQERAYWLASQTDGFGWKEYAADFLPPDYAGALLKYGDIRSPDPGVIGAVLQATFLVGAPFPALHHFHSTCLRNLPAIERLSITMNEVFRLYVAAYQYPHIWKEVWKLCKAIMGVQIIKDVETFVNCNRIDADSVASVVLYGSSRPPDGATLRGRRVWHSGMNEGVGEREEYESIEMGGGSADDSVSVASSATLAPSDSVSVVHGKRGFRYGGDIMVQACNDRQSANSIAAARVMEYQRRRRPDRYANRRGGGRDGGGKDGGGKDGGGRDGGGDNGGGRDGGGDNGGGRDGGGDNGGGTDGGGDNGGGRDGGGDNGGGTDGGGRDGESAPGVKAGGEGDVAVVKVTAGTTTDSHKKEADPVSASSHRVTMDSSSPDPSKEDAPPHQPRSLGRSERPQPPSPPPPPLPNVLECSEPPPLASKSSLFELFPRTRMALERDSRTLPAWDVDMSTPPPPGEGTARGGPPEQPGATASRSSASRTWAPGLAGMGGGTGDPPVPPPPPLSPPATDAAPQPALSSGGAEVPELHGGEPESSGSHPPSLSGSSVASDGAGVQQE